MNPFVTGTPARYPGDGAESGKNLGVVYKKLRGVYILRSGERFVRCELSPCLREQFEIPARSQKQRDGAHKSSPEGDLRQRGDPVAIGDIVHFVPGQDDQGVIIAVLPRRNKLARHSAVPMPSARPFEQVIVANLDQVVPVFAAAAPAPKWKLLDRYLVSAESAGLEALICITKLDLVLSDHAASQTELFTVVEDYRKIGYPVVLTSTVSGEGLDELNSALHGRVSVLLGKSGVGKTSLLNALHSGLGLRIREVSRVSGKGKHTTSHLELFPLDPGGANESGAIVDTPGVQEFGLWDLDRENLAMFFPEMRPYLGHCRFGLDCSHDHEPGCAIRKAVTTGQISPYRWQSYLHLKEAG